jgi:lipoprotein-anchoring transpeptidase ErfK/SrfK
VALVFLATLLLVLSGTLAWATVNDYQQRGLVPTGVSVAGKSLDGMTEAQARAVITQTVATPMMRPVTVTGDKKTFVIDPKGIVTIDTDAMIAEAYAPRRTAPFVARLEHDLAGTPLPAEIKPKYTVDTATIDAWVASTAATINRKPVDAKRLIVKYELKIKPSVYGAKVDQVGTAQRISDALQADNALAVESRVVTIPITASKPHVVESMFKKTLIVSLSQHKVRLYSGAKLEKTYPVAIGTAQYPTPPGDWKIVEKRYLPTWTNPGSAWAKSMPPFIGPGPGNPLGTRALNLSADGIRFHGTNNIGSVGTAASHGCMRMYMPDIEDMYPRVPVNTPVFIRP